MNDAVDEAMRRFGDGRYQIMGEPFMPPGFDDNCIHAVSDAARVTVADCEPDIGAARLRFDNGTKFVVRSSLWVARWHLEQIVREYFKDEMRNRGVPELLLEDAAKMLRVNVDEN